MFTGADLAHVEVHEAAVRSLSDVGHVSVAAAPAVVIVEEKHQIEQVQESVCYLQKSKIKTSLHV